MFVKFSILSPKGCAGGSETKMKSQVAFNEKKLHSGMLRNFEVSFPTLSFALDSEFNDERVLLQPYPGCSKMMV